MENGSLVARAGPGSGALAPVTYEILTAASYLLRGAQF